MTLSFPAEWCGVSHLRLTFHDSGADVKWMMGERRMPSTAAPAIERLTDLVPTLQAAEGFPALLESLHAGRSGTVDGAWGSSAALAVAALAADAPRTVLVVIAHPRALDGWSTGLVSFSGVHPVVFPAWDTLPDEDAGPDETAGQRLRVLKQLEGDNPPRLLLTTLQALMQPVPDRAGLQASRRVLRTGDSLDLEELSGWLLDHGYRRTDVVELPGEFSRRGGILDVFPPDADDPFRVELFGEEVESIRQFNAGTQRSLGTRP